MRLTAAAVALGLFTAGCHPRLAPVTGAPSVAEPNDPFLVVAEADRLATPDLWPGFELRAIPVAIYDGERTLLFRHPAAPDGFEQLPDRPDVWVLHGRHPRVTSNSSAEIGGVLTATLMPAAADVSLRARAGTLIHEAFHVFQRQRHPGWVANEMDLFTYPMDQAPVLSRSRRETEALRRALAANRPDSSACWVRAGLERRRDAISTGGLARQHLAYERMTELNEGLASYVERQATGVPDRFVLQAEDFPPEAVRERAYQVGAAIARLLDRFEPEWKTTIATSDSLPLDVLLANALTARFPGEPCRWSDADWKQSWMSAQNDALALQARRLEQRRSYLEQPGWTVVIVAGPVPFSTRGFDPMNVRRVGAPFSVRTNGRDPTPVGGREVLHTRFVELGNSVAEIEILGRPALTTAAGGHPLLAGVQQVTIAGLASEPLVSAVGDTVSVRGDGFTGRFRGAALERGDQVLTIRVARAPWQSEPGAMSPSQRLAEQLPEFGGAFLDEDRALNVYLTDLPPSARVEEIIRGELIRRGRPDMPVRFLQGRYSYRELASIGHALLPYLGPPGIAYYGINERANRSLIGVVTEEARARLEAAIAELGLPRDAVILEPADYIQVGDHTLKRNRITSPSWTR